VVALQLNFSLAAAAAASEMTEYYRQYLAVAALIFAAVLMVAAMLGAGRLLRPNHPQGGKYVAYESGADPIGGFGQATVRYYIYALLFVMFDVEAVFIFPWAVSLDNGPGGPGLGVFGAVEMLVFVGVLALGLLYAWRKGVLKWA
jgi:NADH-quinone oxidoreductase subunit A